MRDAILKRRRGLFFWVVVASVFVEPLRIYRLPLGEVFISIDRGLRLLALVIYALPAMQRFPRVPRFLPLILLPGVSSLGSIFLLDVPYEVYISNLPMLLLNCWTAAAVYLACRSSPRNCLSAGKCFAGMIIIYMIFFFYTFFIFATTGRVPVDIPFAEILPPDMDTAGHLVYAHMVSPLVPRVTLPYSTPPELSVVTAVLFFISLGLGFYYGPNGGRKYYAIAGLFLMICISSASRSGIFACLAGVIVVLQAIVFRRTKYLWRSSLAILLLVFLLSGGCVVSDTFREYGGDVFTRLVTMGPDYEAHLRSRLEAFEMTFSSLRTTAVGYGFGMYRVVTGYEHAHSSYATLALEQGILGDIIMHLPFFVVFVLLLWRVKDFGPFQTFPLRVLTVNAFALVTCILVSFFLYEFYYTTIVWVGLGWSFGLLAATGKQRRWMNDAKPQN